MTNVKSPLLERRLKTSQITLQKLEVFHLVVRLGGVTRAAERLGIAQPAVTSHLRSLEDKVGATLLRRDGRNLVLTETGERIHTWAVEVIAAPNTNAGSWQEARLALRELLGKSAWSGAQMAACRLLSKCNRPCWYGAPYWGLPAEGFEPPTP
jgi:DNA-binding transcriptional ArsR family regulator